MPMVMPPHSIHRLPSRSATNVVAMIVAMIVAMLIDDATALIRKGIPEASLLGGGIRPGRRKQRQTHQVPSHARPQRRRCWHPINVLKGSHVIFLFIFSGATDLSCSTVIRSA